LFDAKKWGDEVLSMKIGDGMRAACQFGGVSKGEPESSGNHQTLVLAANWEALPPLIPQ
jgi:hypothetical protein